MHPLGLTQVVRCVLAYIHMYISVFPILRLRTIRKRNRLTEWEYLSWLTEERWGLPEMVKPWTGTLHRSEISLHPYLVQGKGSFSKLVNFPQVPGMKGLSIHAWRWWWRWNCTTETRTTTWVLDRFCVTLTLHWCHTSQDHETLVHYLEIGTQFPDSEIVQILRLWGTHIFTSSTVNPWPAFIKYSYLTRVRRIFHDDALKRERWTSRGVAAKRYGVRSSYY